ncbi:MAG: histidine kinase dimerization/phospho-acceptor domain-containing protein [Blautia marasmi]
MGEWGMSGALWTGVVFCLGMLAGAGVFVGWYYRRMRRQLDGVLERLDRAIGGHLQESSFDESMDAAITQRLNQLVEMSQMNCEQADRERNLVKGLISDISHQVRTPLTNIMLYAGLLEEQELGEHAGEMASRIHRQADKLDFL